MNIEQANTIPLVEILRSWGFESDYRRGCKKRYRSPLRKDRNPSFWIDEEQNRWVDFGTGDGGDVPDLIRHFHHLRNTSEALAWLDKHYVNNPFTCPSLCTRGAVASLFFGREETCNFQDSGTERPHTFEIHGWTLHHT